MGLYIEKNPIIINRRKKEITMINHYLLFSGGVDSTYEFIELLDLLRKRSEDHLHVIHISASVTTNKQPHELASVIDIVQYLYKKYDDVWKRVHMTPILLTVGGDYINGYGYGTQHLFWMPTILAYMNYAAIVGDNVTNIIHDCTIMGDHIIRSLKEIDNAIIALYDSRYSMYSKQNELKIDHPLMHKSKRALLEELMTRNKDIVRSTFSCENPKTTDHCGHCEKCTEIIRGLLMIMGNSEDLHDYAEELLRDVYHIAIDDDGLEKEMEPEIDSYAHMEFASKIQNQDMDKIFQILRTGYNIYLKNVEDKKEASNSNVPLDNKRIEIDEDGLMPGEE